MVVSHDGWALLVPSSPTFDPEAFKTTKQTQGKKNVVKQHSAVTRCQYR